MRSNCKHKEQLVLHGSGGVSKYQTKGALVGDHMVHDIAGSFPHIPPYTPTLAFSRPCPMQVIIIGEPEGIDLKAARSCKSQHYPSTVPYEPLAFRK